MTIPRHASTQTPTQPPYPPVPPDDELFDDSEDMQRLMDDYDVDEDGARYIRSGGWA